MECGWKTDRNLSNDPMYILDRFLHVRSLSIHRSANIRSYPAKTFH